MKAEYPLVAMKDISKSMNALSYLQNNISAVFNDSCCNIKEPVSQCLNELFLIHAGQSESLDPVDNVVSQHPDCEICPVNKELLARESIKGETIFRFPDEVLHICPLKMKGQN